jgi:hypothetical protein
VHRLLCSALPPCTHAARLTPPAARRRRPPAAPPCRYVSAASKPLERFDPFEILQLSPDAPDADIKRAYRRLSLQYHPDKNPDPAATEYFTNHVAKAYKALTDPASAENYRKYGHPDGPQAMSISVALPEWFFSKDKDAAPLILLSLLLGGIVLPLGLAACYMGRSAQFTGPNEVLRDTVAWYWASPWAVKQQQGVGRIPETLVCAAEFVKMTTTPVRRAQPGRLRGESGAAAPRPSLPSPPAPPLLTPPPPTPPPPSAPGLLPPRRPRARRWTSSSAPSRPRSRSSRRARAR